MTAIKISKCRLFVASMCFSFIKAFILHFQAMHVCPFSDASDKNIAGKNI